MPRNGSGGYNLPPGINPVVTQTLITSNWANTTLDDVAVALTNSLSKDGQTVPTANLQMGGFAHTGAGDPASRDMYSTLGYVQDGKHLRLTNVAGVNQVTATLPGGATALSVGQIVQFIPALSNTGPVTLNINGIGDKSIRTDIGNELAAGNLIAGRPYLLSYTGTEWILITAGGGSAGIAQSAMSGWDRPTSTGPYPPLTAVNSTTIAVPAGKGRIVKPSARDLSGVTEVAWAAQNVVLTNVATAWATIIGVNAGGQVVQFTGAFNPVWARENILLGSVSHINGAIDEINTIPAIFGDMTYASYDVAGLLHNTLISGGRLFPNAANAFQVDLEAGSIFTLGGDSTDVNDPNRKDFAAAFSLFFYPVTGTNGVTPQIQNVPVTQYDANGAGVVAAIPGPAATATIHRMYLLAGEFVFLYGQKTYTDLDTALSQIGIDDASIKFPSKLTNATLLGYIVAQKDCLDLKDTTKARLLAKGGASFNIGSAGSISEAPIDGLLYARKNAAWAETIAMPRGAATTARSIPFYTNTTLRWTLTVNGQVESGSNAGSGFDIRAYDDAGAFLNTPFTINRATGAASFINALTAGSHITSSADVRANSNFASTNTSAVLATSAAGNIFFRPNGSASATGQTTIAANGAMSVAGSVTAGSSFIAGNSQFSGVGAQVILGPATPGTIFFQPQGVGVGTNQGFIDINGGLTLAGGATIAGAISVGQNFGSSTSFAVLGPASPVAGTVLLRPNGVNVATGEVAINNLGGINAPGDMVSGGLVAAATNFVSSQVNVVLANNGAAGGVFLRPNGAGNSAGQGILNSSGQFSAPSFSATGGGYSGTAITVAGGTAGATIQDRTSGRNWQWYGSSDVFRLHNASADIVTIDSSGVITSVNQVATSDENLKDRITKREARRNLADLIDLYSYVWKSSGRAGLGQIAQRVREVAPEYVHEGTDGILSIDKASLAMECIIGLAARVRELEEKVNATTG